MLQEILHVDRDPSYFSQHNFDEISFTKRCAPHISWIYFHSIEGSKKIFGKTEEEESEKSMSAKSNEAKFRERAVLDSHKTTQIAVASTINTLLHMKHKRIVNKTEHQLPALRYS